MSSPALTSEAAKTAAQAMGTAIGTLMFTFFGTIWIVVGFAMQHRAPLWQIATLAVVAVVLARMAFTVIRKTSEAAKQVDPKELDRRRRVFKSINIAQWSAVVAVIVIANIIHKPQIILPSVILIVGLHFLPLAAAFRYFPHYWTGVALIAWALVYPLIGKHGTQVSEGPFGAGIIILASGAVSLMAAYRRLHTFERL